MSAEAAAAMSSPAARDSPARGRVLVAEDDETNQLYAMSLLERDGWEVDLAMTGREAIDLGNERNYDVILMDCHMPELGGYEAVRELRALEGAARHTPIIALTAHDTKSHRDSCRAAGMDGYIVKPFDLGTLRNVLDVVCVPRLSSIPPHADASESGEIVDGSRLGALPGEVGARLVGLFVGSNRQRVADLAVAVRSGDTATARKLTHTVMGSSATIGATAMTVACAQLGAALRRHDGDAIAAGQTELERAFALTEPALLTAHAETSDGHSDPG